MCQRLKVTINRGDNLPIDVGISELPFAKIEMLLFSSLNSVSEVRGNNQ